jgi:hypothetical protein
LRLPKKTYITYPEMNQAERQELFEKVMGEERKGYDYDIVEEKLEGRGRFLVYLREDALENENTTQTKNAIVLGYRKTNPWLRTTKIVLIPQRQARKNIETHLEKQRIKVLNFLE